jgi:cysteine synthase A
VASQNTVFKAADAEICGPVTKLITNDRIKTEGTNPTGSMKDRMALSMIEQAENEGLLLPGQRVVENTGGSTGSSLAMVCSVKGYSLLLVSADCITAEKLDTMRGLGADLEVLETPDGELYPGLSEEMQTRARVDLRWAWRLRFVTTKDPFG